MLHKLQLFHLIRLYSDEKNRLYLILLMNTTVFVEFGLLLVITASVATVMKILRQPMIIGYIATGLLVGPQFLNIVSVDTTFEAFSHFGLALLLFIIGLGLNPRVIREVGRASFITGLGQVIFTAIAGYAIARTLNFNPTEAFYIGIALTLSSTIIILKILSDKRETNQLYAKIITGLLLVQDMVATILLISVASSSTNQNNQWMHVLGASMVLASGLVLVSVFILPRLEKFVSSGQEYLFLFSIAWGFGVASLFSVAGLSIEVGALFAGIALSPLAYSQEVSSRLRPLRDFFVILFFIALGARIEITNLQQDLLPALIFSSYVLIGNPLIVMSLMGLMGYTKKTSFKAAMTVAQISEFSLVFVLLAASMNKIDERIVGIITLVGLITIAVSSYMMLFDETLFRWVGKYLNLFERRYVRREKRALHNADIILFGYKRGGKEFVHTFERLGKKFLVVDYDPDVIEELKQTERTFAYGDANDAEFLDEIDFEKARMVISAISDYQTSMFLTIQVRARNPDAIIIVHAEHPEEAMQLYDHHASYVMMPRYIGSERVSQMISKAGFRRSEFNEARDHHLDYVKKHLI